MTDSIAGLPFWDLVFDADGDPDTRTTDALLAETGNLTDLYVFSHGWNNDRSIARNLYNRFYEQLARQLAADPRGTAGLAGVYWPAIRWSDEPIPNFTPAAAAGGGGGIAAATPAATETAVADPVLDEKTLADLLQTFPDAKDSLERMAALLRGDTTQQTLDDFFAALNDFAEQSGTGENDGEVSSGKPRMLDDGPNDVFARYRDALVESGVDLPRGDGTAGIGDKLGGLLNGAKEALRVATYWEMKGRAGVVGRKGLGPLLGRLPAGLRVHLIGHSFGARLVSYAIGAPQVKSVTLLQGAFSHFAFCKPLPFDAGRNGALGGQQQKVDGPVTVCFSAHDGAVGRFYPLASLAKRDDVAAGHGLLWRWGGMGADGAQNTDAVLDGIKPAGPGTTYRFARNRILNIDCSQVVSAGKAPSGAHSDILHPEVTWIVLAASRFS
ncbi:hypothetical protein BJ973_003406 [Actinoplanes tereljensis]|uniref:Serine-threonine protein kinase n=1 Tax=Paractinoplanes tereljensis TaxID=571912 RepID=A0A919TXC8_9ACTN|nr:hypothetical protein [Actinoplanes tereljensis]GIF26136.1 hypothetical protein Ate02nite_88660 [Actinoplanes tereljensis]